MSNTAILLVAFCSFGLCVFSPMPANAQTPGAPPLVTPSADYRGVGEGTAGLQKFSSSSFDSGNVAWELIGSMSGLFMITPGLLFFYCGLLKTRGAQALVVRYLGYAAVLSMAWVIWIYSPSFARNTASYDVLESERAGATTDPRPAATLIGGPDHTFLQGLESQLGDEAPRYPLRRRFDGIPHLLFMASQMMFFISVPVPLIVAMHGRLTPAGSVCFVLIWGTIVYAPITYWVWGGGWHAAALDTAGGIPAHLSVGFSLLAATLVVRQQSGGDDTELSHRIVYMAIGTTLYWGGSLLWSSSRPLAADGFAVNAFVATHLAACAGLLGWTGTDWLVRGRAGLTGFCAGPVAGLVTIASGAGYVAPQSSIVIGLLGGALACRVFGTVKRRFAGNPMLVVFSLQAIGGTLGVLLTGVFATASVAGFDQRGNAIAGLLVGNPGRLATQAAAVVSAAILAMVGTFMAISIVRLGRGVRPGGANEAQKPSS